MKTSYFATSANAARIHRRELVTRKVVRVVSVASAIITTGILIYIVAIVLRHPIAGTTSAVQADPVLTAKPALTAPPLAAVRPEAPKPIAVAAVVKAPVEPVAPRSVSGRFVLSSDKHSITITDDGGKDITLGIAHPKVTLDHQDVEIDGLKSDLAVNVLYAGTEATLIEQATPPPPPVASTSSPTPAPVVAQAGSGDNPKKKKNKKKKPPAM